MLTINSSTRKVVCLLSVLALMLASVNCLADGAEDNDVSREECTRLVADTLARESVPKGLNALVAHVNDIIEREEEEGKVEYVPVEQPEACKILYEMFAKLEHEVPCFDTYWDTSSSEYIKANSTVKPLLDANFACQVNEEKLEELSDAECHKEVKVYLAAYSLPKEVNELVEHVNEGFAGSSPDEKSAASKYVNVKQPEACDEVHEKLKQTLHDVPCISHRMLISATGSSEEQTAQTLFEAVRACRINLVNWAQEGELDAETDEELQLESDEESDEESEKEA